MSFPLRLNQIYIDLNQIIEEYKPDAIIVNVSSENPDDLPQDEVSDVVQIMDKFMAYHTNYNQIKEKDLV